MRCLLIVMLLGGMLRETYADDRGVVNRNRELAISDQGVGPIQKGTKYDLSLLKKLLPGYVLTTNHHVYEGGEAAPEHIEVRLVNQLLMEIDQDVLAADRPIVSVSVFSAMVRNSLGDAIGKTFGNIYGEKVPANCYVGGGGKDIATVVCKPLRESKNLIYTFDGAWPPGEESFDMLPPYPYLSGFKLTEITWLASPD